jgi:serine/threonine-protein kinase OSR1/STK39
MPPSAKRVFVGAVEDHWPYYSDSADDYDLGPTIGFGASSTVYAATFKPTNTPCAVKVWSTQR